MYYTDAIFIEVSLTEYVVRIHEDDSYVDHDFINAQDARAQYNRIKDQDVYIELIKKEVWEDGNEEEITMIANA